MAVVDRILGALGLSRLAEQTLPPAGDGIDADDYLYRRLSQSQRDLSPLQHDRHLQIVSHLFEMNPLARRIVEQTKDFVVGDGFTVSSPVPEIDAVLKAFWKDPITDLAATQHNKALELGLCGEQILQVFTNEVSGHVRLGVIDPIDVSMVIHDPDNRTIPVGIQLKGQSPRKYRTLYSEPDPTLFTAPTVQLRETLSDGDVFYFAVNKLTGMTRGRSDLLCLIDWLDGYDRYLFDGMERAALINAFIWDVTLDDMKETDIQAWLMKHGVPPKPGTVRAHNQKEKWEAQTPDLKQSDTREGGKTLRNHILGGAGIPVHWYGEGEDSNKASATEMGTPVFRRLKTRQLVVKTMLLSLCRYQVQRAIQPAPGVRGPLAEFERVLLPGASDPVPATEAILLQEAAISTKDLQQAATTLLAVSQAVSLNVMNGLMQKSTAIKIITVAANELGVDLNPQDEIEALASGAKPLTESETDRLYTEIQSHLARLKEVTANGR